MYMLKKFFHILPVFLVAGFLCGCGPSESDILNSKTKKNIEEHYSEPGQPAVFVKRHSFAQYSDTGFMVEVIIRKNGKKYLTAPLYIEIVDGKMLISYPEVDIPGGEKYFLLREL